MKKTVKDALLAGQTFPEIRAAMDKAYRNTPGVAEKHMPRIIEEAVKPAYAKELPGGTISQPAIDAARSVFLSGGSNDDISAATVDVIHGSADWRRHIREQNIDGYWAQPDNWSCGPASAANILGLLGVTEEGPALHAKIVVELQARPDIGTPGGVWAIADGIKRVASRDHGVELTGYDGNAKDFNAIREALNDGYVLLVNGTVTGTTDAGHFLVIEKLTDDGRLMMAFPWTPEYGNSVITFEQSNDFVDNWRGTFYALGRA